ncbi:hypothetical protein G9A89_017778 [Geosiphon pyriformis]|nr:hypothetical protein G9A89_017778 [Geosiphon pyriformis]
MVASKYFLDQSFSSSRLSVAVQFGGLNVLESDVFSSVQDGLHEIWSGCFEAYTNGSLKRAGTADVSSSAAVYFPALGLGVGVKVCGLLSSTMAELQAVALALECVSSSSSVVLYFDSQAAINVCIFEMLLKVPDFRNHYWIERRHVFDLIRDKDLSVNWIKIKDHAGVLGNMEVNRFARETACSFFVLPIRIWVRFLVADDTVVSSNACHFVRNVFRSICYAYWKAGPGWDVVLADMLGDFDWAASAKIWYFNLHMLAGFTSHKSADLCTYLMKDVHIWREILLEASVHWASLVGACDLSFFSVLQVLDSCHLDVGRYLVLCKSFVMKIWCAEAADVFDDVKKASCVVVDFMRFLVELHQSRVWLVRSRFRADMEKTGLVSDNDLVLGLFCCMSSVFSDSVIRMLDIIKSFAISFGHLRSCLFFLGLDDKPYVNISV